jgi:hypothetical protein
MGLHPGRTGRKRIALVAPTAADSSCTTSAPPWSISVATSVSSTPSTCSPTPPSRSILTISELPFCAHWIASQPLEAQRTAIQAMSPEQLQKFRQQWSWWSGRPPLPRRGPRPNTRPDRWNTRRFTRIGRRRRTRPCPHRAPAAQNLTGWHSARHGGERAFRRKPAPVQSPGDKKNPADLTQFFEDFEPSGGLVSAASALASSTATSAFSCASSFPACS